MQQRSMVLEPLLAATVGQQTVVADFDEARPQEVQTQAPDKLLQRQAHRLVPRPVGVVFVIESHGAGSAASLLMPVLIAGPSSSNDAHPPLGVNNVRRANSGSSTRRVKAGGETLLEIFASSLLDVIMITACSLLKTRACSP
jgi:hypothetical protein